MGSASVPTAASDLLDASYAAWNAHEVGAGTKLVTEDVRYEDPAAHT